MPRTLSRLQNYPMTSMTPARIADYVGNALSEDGQKKEWSQQESKHKNDAVVHSSERRSSVYSSDYRNEITRLKIQAKNSETIDKQALSYIYKDMGDNSDEKLCILDVGSAYGFVAADRFGDDSRVDKILCIDKNERVIERAQILFADNRKMIFEVIDVESDNFVNDILMLMNKHNIEKINIVFSALILHHLKDPNRVLRNLRKVMDRGTYIFVRGSDDGSKLCHPGYDLMKEIITSTVQATGVSDRFNGRKIYSQLINSGFKDIKMFSIMKDISEFDYDDRGLLFNESFAYRVNYFYRAVEADPDNEKAKGELSQMQKYLKEFENLFYESDFWYCEYDYVGIARK